MYTPKNEGKACFRFRDQHVNVEIRYLILEIRLQALCDHSDLESQKKQISVARQQLGSIKQRVLSSISSRKNWYHTYNDT